MRKSDNDFESTIGCLFAVIVIAAIIACKACGIPLPKGTAQEAKERAEALEKRVKQLEFEAVRAEQERRSKLKPEAEPVQ